MSSPILSFRPISKSSWISEHFSNQDVIYSYCGLCGKEGRLTRTRCCSRVVCDDADSYQMFTYARNSCYRNHDRYTVCSTHSTEHGGVGKWQDCAKCKEHFNDIESYVGFGTSSFNFMEEKWEDPPAFETTSCSRCGKMIKLNSEPYIISPGDGKLCQDCSSHKYWTSVRV